MSVHTLLLALAVVCFFVAAVTPIFGWAVGRFQAVAWGLFFWSLANFI